MAPDDNFGQHMNPVWRSDANYIFGAAVPDMGDGLWEQLWGRRDDDGVVTVCCIPFFAHELNLGDRVELTAGGMAGSVVSRSGRTTLRVWWRDASTRGDVEGLLGRLESLGVLVEWYSASLMAVDLESPQKRALVVPLLEGLGEKVYYGDRFG